MHHGLWYFASWVLLFFGRLGIPLANTSNVGDEHVQMICPGLKLDEGLETLDLAGASVTTDEGVEYINCNFFLKHILISLPFEQDEDAPSI
jgi:hypothetical protein